MATRQVKNMVARWVAKSQPLAPAAKSFSTTATPARAQNVGIVAMESYVANRYVSQEALEKADGVSAGKYTIGAFVTHTLCPGFSP